MSGKKIDWVCLLVVTPQCPGDITQRYAIEPTKGETLDEFVTRCFNAYVPHQNNVSYVEIVRQFKDKP